MSDLLPGDYWPPVLELLPHPLGHVSTVTAHPTDADPFLLEVEAGSLSVQFSEDWSPFAQVRLDLPAMDLDRVESLDPRKNCRLEVSAGYVYPGGREEVLPLADVVLRERPISRPADLVSLTASSDEALAQDNRIMFPAAPPRTGINETVAWLLNQALAPARPVLSSDYAPGSAVSALADLEVELADDYWAVLDDVAARTGTRIWCDETRTWRIQARPEAAGPTSLDLTVGKNGTIITSESGLSREEWYNAVLIRYRWRDAAGNEQERVGRARAWEGPYSVPEVGAKVYAESVSRPVSQAGADAAAASRLRTLFSRGRSLSLTAGAAYWLRPGHTVRVTLATGPTEDHLVQSVTFHPHAGTMDIKTRQPNTLTITNGE